MDSKNLTVQEVLEITIKLLNDIQVPVGLMGSIGQGIAYAVSNLEKCVGAMKEAEAHAKQKEEKKDAAKSETV